jgi:signal transduction histidine kinase
MMRHEDLHIVVSTIVARYEIEASRYRVTLDSDNIKPLPPVYINELYFPDVLANLILNGIKFSNGQNAHVSVATDYDDQWVKIEITDNGIGIAPGHIRYLFEPFRQINRDKLEQQGVGIGLYVAQELIRLHGGEITVSSQLGAGSIFTINLPRSK